MTTGIDFLRDVFAAGIQVARSYGDNAVHLYGEQLERQFQAALQRLGNPSVIAEIAKVESPPPPNGAPDTLRHRGDLQRWVKDLRAARTLDEAMDLARLCLPRASERLSHRWAP